MAMKGLWTVPTHTLPAFTNEEYARARRLLAAHVAYMLGRKLEEADWTDVYCSAKGLPRQGWSNLNIDVMHQDLGVEHKMLGRPGNVPITRDCGTSLMHPSLTRAVRIATLDADPNEVMREVFAQYAEVVEGRRRKVMEQGGTEAADLRTGWFLWQYTLHQFLYFEERMSAPDPAAYRAVWNVRGAAGGRRGSKNLWIYETATDQKRYSITTEAGIKIQPYFDVPAQDDPNLYLFVAQGEEVEGGLVRVWLTESTANDLEAAIGSLESRPLSDAILAAEAGPTVESVEKESDAVREVLVSADAYEKMQVEFDALSDELRFRSLVGYLRAS